METNDQLELARNFVQFTDRNIFLTGKAGTGKTTFLHDIRKSCLKRMVVLAPTGVAAINAGGVTLHSFFQLAFAPYIPSSKIQQASRKFNREKISLIKSLDLLIIDEISMVRADVLDQVDEVLRRYRDHQRPFGGVQLLMIGDLHQLSPVVKEEEWNLLRPYYDNPYFFSSNALKKSKPVCIELKKIYRQADQEFISLLNSIRKKDLSQSVLDKLNTRYRPDFQPAEDEAYITLTTHNNTANDINLSKLEALEGRDHVFQAKISGDFPEFAYPTGTELRLKVGAQVMFVKNDPGREKLFYNGKLGVVTAIDDDNIYVKCPDLTEEIVVSPLEWTNIRYDLNSETKEIEEKIAGTFVQYPLKLAWAITIHKSQGLTFERAIIDAQLAFAHGQVYVALSRCKSLEGIILRSAIKGDSVKTDGTVSTFTLENEQRQPGPDELQQARIEFQQNQLFELFDFTTLKQALIRIKKFAETNDGSVDNTLNSELALLQTFSTVDIINVAEGFVRQLRQLLIENKIPEENAAVQDRIKRAAAWFSDKLDSLLTQTAQVNLSSDNKSVEKDLKSKAQEIRHLILVKKQLIRICAGGFSTHEYMRAKANIDIDQTNESAKSTESGRMPPVKHPLLYRELKSWRDSLAANNNLPVYMVFPAKALTELCNALPSNLKALEAIKGIGKTRVRKHGPDILEIVKSYCERTGAVPEKHQESPKAPKPETRRLSLDLFKTGKTIAEIAAQRSLALSTIEGHLVQSVREGDLNLFDLVPKAKVAKITAFIVQHPESTLSEIKAAMGDDISYGELRAVSNHLKVVQTED